MNLLPDSILSVVVSELTEQPTFGEWQTITADLLSYYDQSLSLLETEVPAAGTLCQYLRSANPATRFLVVTDTVFRVVINRAVQLHYHFLDDPRARAFSHAQELCTALVKLLAWEPDLTATPLQALGIGRSKDGFVGKPPMHIVTWKPQQITADFEFASEFKTIIEQEIEPGFALGPVQMRPFTPEEYHTLQLGLAILPRISPRLAQEPLVHVRAIGLVDLIGVTGEKDYAGSNLIMQRSNNNVPGAIFLSPRALEHPITAAEGLLHEALHHKMTNLVTVLDIFVDGFDRDNYPPILANWNRASPNNSKLWQLDRALFAFHFYVHICAYYVLLQEKWQPLTKLYGCPPGFDPAGAFVKAVGRAEFLYSELSNQSGFLGSQGKQLLSWLGSIVQLYTSKQSHRIQPTIS